MEDHGGRFRKKRRNFSMVSNTIIRDDTISLKAKGLYALIQSYITLDCFTVYKGFLLSKCSEGKKGFETAWQELKKTGYLLQYRMQDDDTKQFYWEYELLDDPHPQKGDMDIKPLPPKGCNGFGMQWKSDDMGNGGDINNIIQKNIIQNNTNQIISISDVKDQIGYDAFSITDINLVDEIALLINDILNVPDGRTVWIAKEPIQSELVKERFSQLNKFHIDYVLECMKSNTNKITNIKSYLLTALYNAPATMNNYYQNKYNKGDKNYDEII